MRDPLVVGVLFPRRHGAGAALRAGRLIVLALDAAASLRDLGTIVQPPAPPARTTVSPHLQVAR